MPETPEQFYERARESADAEGRLPIPQQSMWEIFPFELDGLRVKPLEALVLPEPARRGEDGSQCWQCANPEADVIWSDERWTVRALGEEPRLPFAAMLCPRAHFDLGDLDDVHAAELGPLIVRIERAAMSLGNLGRVHVNKWGDGGAHLHLIFLGRPAGLLQLRGSNLPLWEEMFPPIPADLAQEGLREVAQALAAAGGRAHI